MEDFQGTNNSQDTYDFQMEDDGQSSNQNAPALQIPTNRSMLKLVLLGILTLGIYPLVINSKMSENINTIASKYDGKKTMHYCLLFFLVAPITLGIGLFVWNHRFANRIGAELERRHLSYAFSARTFWLWNILGILIIVGPFVYTHKLCTAMNMLAADYNVNG